jgi:hypothetical protein
LHECCLAPHLTLSGILESAFNREGHLSCAA